MKIPGGEFATVDLAKLRDYCLNPSHPEGKHKARIFFPQCSGSPNRFGVDAQFGETDKYGDRYVVDFTVTKDARQATVRSAWIIPPGTEIPHLTSCYVLLKRGQND